ncbi:MAG: hypothetical protein ABJF65_00130 [Reichenbachiella sp.]|uniref:hypothetical protein n=1 Tax=Reichenbachiella sp. TaxID=2184521 RepID=UPI003264FDD9
MSKTTLLEIHVWIDNNSDSVRGKKRVLDSLQLYHNLEKVDSSNYTRKAIYDTEKDIDSIANDIIEEAHSLADLANCYVEISILNKEFDKAWD